MGNPVVIVHLMKWDGGDKMYRGGSKGSCREDFSCYAHKGSRNLHSGLLASLWGSTFSEYKWKSHSLVKE